MKVKKILAAIAAFVVTVILVTVALIQSNVVTKIAESSAINSMQQEVNLMVQSLEDDAAISITEEIGAKSRNMYNIPDVIRFTFVDIDKGWNESLAKSFGLGKQALKNKLVNNQLSDEQLKAVAAIPGTPSFKDLKDEVVSNFRNNPWHKTEAAIGELEAMIAEKYLPVLPKLQSMEEKLAKGITPTLEDAQFVKSLLDGNVNLSTFIQARYDILNNGTINPDLGLSVTELDATVNTIKVVRSATRPDLVKYDIAFDYNQSVDAINAIESSKINGVILYFSISLVIAVIVAVAVWKKASAKEANNQEMEKIEAEYKKQKEVSLANEDVKNAGNDCELAGKALTAAKEKLDAINEEIESISQKAVDEDNKVEAAKQNLAEAEERLNNDYFSKELAIKEQELKENTIVNSEIAAANDFAKDEQELKDIEQQLATVSDGSELIDKVKVVREHAEHCFAKKIPLNVMIKEFETAYAKVGGFNLHSLIKKLQTLPQKMRLSDAEKQKFAAEVAEICNKLESDLKKSTLKVGSLKARQDEIEQARKTLGAERVKQLSVLSEKVNKCYILTGEIAELKGRVEELESGPEEAMAELKKVQEEATKAKAEINKELKALSDQRIEATGDIKSAEIKVETTKLIFEKALERSNALKECNKSFNTAESDETEKSTNAKSFASNLLKKVGAIWNSIPLPNFHKNTISCIAGALVVLVTFF
jgi:hypothetical protein